MTTTVMLQACSGKHACKTSNMHVTCARFHIGKVDIKHAHHNIPIHPDNRWLLGMAWEGAYIDTALPFSLRSTPKISNAVVDAIEWILKEAGISVVFHYLDDFLLIGAPNSTKCAQALSIFLQTFAFQ